MFKRLRDWIRERPKTLRFCLTVVLFVLALGFLLAIALRTPDFIESFALNFLTEIIGALVVVYLLEGYVRRVSEEMEKELVVLKRSLDAALQAWDRGEIPIEKVREVAQWRCWNKWVQLEDEAGWHELQEAVRFGDGLTSFVRSVVEMELERVQSQVSKTGSQSVEEKEYEKRLQALLTP